MRKRIVGSCCLQGCLESEGRVSPQSLEMVLNFIPPHFVKAIINELKDHNVVHSLATEGVSYELFLKDIGREQPRDRFPANNHHRLVLPGSSCFISCVHAVMMPVHSPLAAVI